MRKSYTFIRYPLHQRSLPVRTSYAKNLQKKQEKIPETPIIKRKHRQTKDTRWVVLINGKQVGDLMNSTDECYDYIEKKNLSSKLPQIGRVEH